MAEKIYWDPETPATTELIMGIPKLNVFQIMNPGPLIYIYRLWSSSLLFLHIAITKVAH